MSTAKSQPPPPPLVEENEEQPTRDEEKPPSGPQHQPLGLQDTCVKTLARHLEVFAHPRHRYRVVPLDLFLRILRGCHSHAWVQAADLMLRVTRNLPCLDAPEVDDLYWRTVCELSVSPTTPITMPYPILLGRVVELKKALDEWMAAAATRAVAAAAAGAGSKQGESQDGARGEGEDAAATKKEKEKGSKAAAKEEVKGEADKGSKKEKDRACSRTDQEGKKKKKKEKKEKKEKKDSTVNSGSIPAKISPIMQKQQQQREDQASAAVLRLLRELSRLPMSVQLLKDADWVGESVRQLSKMKTMEGGKEGEGGSSGEGVVSEEVSRAATKLRRKWKALLQEEQEEKDRKEEGEDEEKGEEPMSPARVGARALVVQTWRDVYIFSKEYEELRRGWIGKRALALAEDHESKKRRTRGIEEKLGDAATIEAEARKGKPPVGNTERIRKLVNYRPPPAMDSKKKPFGGIAFVAPQKKKHLKVVKLR